MVINRIVRALLKQEWATVTIETLVVLFGVFLGLQANNWNEDRLHRERERQLISRMADDFTVIRDSIDAGLDMTEMSMDGCLVALEAINIANGKQPGDLPSDDDLLYATLDCAASFRLYGQSATLREMISSGELSQLEDTELRSLLYEFDQRYEASSASYQTNRMVFSAPAIKLIYELLKMEIYPNAESRAEQVYIYGLDTERMFSEPEIMHTLFGLKNMAQANHAMLQEQSERVKRIRTILRPEDVTEN